jgi:hypothetical protein
MSSLVKDEPEILAAILDSSERNNKRNNITGMMSYSDGNVMQVLEGEKETVLKTYQAVQLDLRHYDIFLLLDEEIATRIFASWSMGFRQISTADMQEFPLAANVFKVRPSEIALRVQPSDVLIILKSFADGSMGIS